MAKNTGITARHSRTCASRETGARCNCTPSYEAWVWSKKDEKKIRETFSGKGALSAAKNWRADKTRAVRLKEFRAPTTQTLKEAWEEFLAKAQSGEIRNRRRQTYKPATLRQYESAITIRVLPELGDRRLSDIDSTDLIDLKEHLQGTGISDSTLRNCFVPLQALFRRAKLRQVIAVNPAADLELPTGDNGRERAVTPKDAVALLKALPKEDQALWATAFYCGLRRGELRALRAVDINETCIHVEYGWDDKEGQQAPKSLASRRDVPLTKTLRAYLDAHLKRTKRSGEDLVFGRTATEPFTPHHLSDRADDAWTKAKVERVTLHECRHSYSTWLDAAGVSEERSDRYMGHSRGTIGSRYRHPTEYAEDAKRLDSYLTGATAGKVITLTKRAAS
jgi:integrase